MRAVSFAVATPEEVRQLDRLAGELRTDRRKRLVAEGLPIQEAFALFMMEEAGKVGSR